MSRILLYRRRMGYPRRFYGTGEAVEIDGVVIPARCAVEVTFRTLQQRFFLRPDEDANEIILGCFGRAYDRYPSINVNILDVMSNHGSFVCVPDSPAMLSRFMQDFMSDTARRLNRNRERDGKFWERRFRAIPIVDEAKMDDRFHYVLTQGTKEGLVWSARDWPGVTSIDALLHGKPLVGRWRDRSAEAVLRQQRNRKLQRAHARGKQLELPETPQVWREYPIPLVPMPHWADLTTEERRARVANMLEDDDEQTRTRHAQEGTAPIGVDLVLRTDPFARPAEPKMSPAPLCHASTRAARNAYRALYRTYLETTHAAREVARSMLDVVGLPLCSTLPPLTNDRHGGRSSGRSAAGSTNQPNAPPP